MSISKDQAIKTALTGDWETAIALNEELLKETPDDIETLNRLALAFSIMGKAEKAKTMYLKVLEIDALNSIAQKGLRRLKSDSSKKTDRSENLSVNNTFIEETGKTKVVELINTAQPEILSKLKMGQYVDLSIKRLKIFVLERDSQYLGVLPDDIGKRLIKFIKSGSKYEAYIKSSSPNSVSVFVREIKKSARFKDQPSFVYAETKLPYKKPKEKKEDDDTAAEAYEEE